MKKRSSNAGDTPLPYGMGMLRHRACLVRFKGNKIHLVIEIY